MSGNVIKCVAVGDGFVGKTTLLMRLCGKEIDKNYTPTIFENHSISTVHNGQNYDIVLFDTAGQEDYSLLRKQVYESADVFLICFDVTNASSFANVKTVWIPEIEEIGISQQAKILLGTKCDLRCDPETIDRLNANREIFISENMAKKLAESHNMKYVECSAFIEKNTQHVVQTILEVYKAIPPEIQKSSTPSVCCINPVLRLIQRVICCKNNY
ncbi:Cdc42 homolog-like Protein [Tribolium castaneum]|uniref:Cdc42 homolog-like Protein n=1 Tax=Tribolium castaneum TaxID=7070 RepID=A0A139WID3_TRICA|nr:PREDICTED: cell division control protein 42 homolog [Tribolium castaneum]KYB27692.1 Cdc42 homolog-like Protein [Tribolium castaneum]|eukprot:XP_008200449.1 PREDICTED: cell division control protein 42 homolog [Tribolium castaneum]